MGATWFGIVCGGNVRDQLWILSTVDIHLGAQMFGMGVAFGPNAGELVDVPSEKTSLVAFQLSYPN